MKKKAIFYFDYISPYAYLAWQKVRDICHNNDTILIPKPILFAGLLKQWESKGPAEIETKRLYTYKDILRLSNKEKVKLKFPPTHPFNPLLALRSTCLFIGSDDYQNFITKVFNLCWLEGKDIQDPEIVNKALLSFGIKNGIERTKEISIKDQLKNNTNEAIEKGVFGVPTMYIDQEMFWGNDRLIFFEDYLKGKDPITSEDTRKFKELPFGVKRLK